ncbi:hypothetical protein QFC21_004396 [Naganishia friedmannii]|uniref:Uncharacterized protein n=1 Tax=Naganishia friedmannii TaxID=89922 RepID=A0ACC2VI54_9TREE|nr:hypothetical protein QFC21_004396 [Naganishia friedmannii]
MRQSSNEGLEPDQSELYAPPPKPLPLIPAPSNRSDKDVETRLRNLEQIMSMMSREPTDKGVTLSEEQLAGIWAAAQCSPGSAGGQPPNPPPAGGIHAGTSVSYAVEETPGPWMGHDVDGYAEMGGEARASRGMLESLGMNGRLATVKHSPPSFTEGDLGMENSWFNPSPDAGPSFQSNPTQRLSYSGDTQGPRPDLPFQQSSQEQVAHSGTSNQSRRDLMYHGMPLLDLLKELNVAAEIPRRTYSSAEDWISMSTASGLGGYPFLLDANAESSSIQRSSAEGQLHLSESDLLQPDLGSNDIWPRVTAIAPQLLLDNLVQAYFTTSHLLWPILHAPQFMSRYTDSQRRRDPSFVALVLSMACLSSRYIGDLRWGVSTEMAAPVGIQLLELCKSILQNEAADREDLEVVQATFNLAVYLGGTSKPYSSLIHLSKAITISLQTGLHRRVSDWESFSLVDTEIRTRTFWALYCLGVETSATFGVPPLLRLADCDVSEPLPVDDAYITEAQGVQPWPEESPSVMAGFVASIRLHVVLERAVTRINDVSREDGSRTSFLKMALATSQPSSHLYDEINLTEQFASGLPGDWVFTPLTITHEDNVHFFRKTRAFTLQHFIRLLVARHRFLTLLSGSSGSTPNGQESTEEQVVLEQVTQAALGIIGTYATILANGRLRLFGAHAITQLSQSGAGLVGVILQVQGKSRPDQQHLLRLAIQGLSSSISLLRHLGLRVRIGSDNSSEARTDDSDGLGRVFQSLSAPRRRAATTDVRTFTRTPFIRLSSPDASQATTADVEDWSPRGGKS